MDEEARISLEETIESARKKVESSIPLQKDAVTKNAILRSIDFIKALYNPEISELLVEDIREGISPDCSASENLSLARDMVEVYTSESFNSLRELGTETTVNSIILRRMSYPDFDKEGVQKMFDLLASYKDSEHFDLIYDCMQRTGQRWGSGKRFEYVMDAFGGADFRTLLSDFNGPQLRGITSGVITVAGLRIEQLSFKKDLFTRFMEFLRCYVDKQEIAGELSDSFDYIIKGENERYLGERTDEQMIRDKDKAARFLIGIYRGPEFRNFVVDLPIAEVKELAESMAKRITSTESYGQTYQVFLECQKNYYEK